MMAGINIHNIKTFVVKLCTIYIVFFFIFPPVLLSKNSSVLYIDDKSLDSIDYTMVYNDIRFLTKSEVYSKGTPGYNKRRILENGLCNNVYPDLIVVPKSTNDVASIVKISRKYKVPLSVRSGGHSYICASIKPHGIHIDMRSLNKIELTTRYPFGPPGPALRLGPGQTWGRVLAKIPADRYTYIHGQCTAVGVGGYLLGGGIQASGTTQRLGFGSFNVLEYTMVNAEGEVMKISGTNITLRDSKYGIVKYLEDSHNLFRSLQFAGSSFGITTEFHYRIFEGPEVLPVFAFVYMDNEEDLLNFQRATADGRYSLTLYTYQFVTPLNFFANDLFAPNIVRILLKLIPFFRLQKSVQ